MKVLRFLAILILFGCTSQRHPTSHIPIVPVVTTHISALTGNDYPHFLSNYAKIFLEALASDTPICKITPEYIPTDRLMRHYPIGILQDSIFCITGFLEVEKGFNLKQFKRLGIYFIQSEQLFSTAYIPLASLCDFLKLRGIIRFELGRQAEGDLNVARPAVNAQILLRPGSGAPTYDGNGIIIGVVDYGFDYTHPDFYDITGSVYRIRRVWEQSNENGAPPSGFPYGRELTEQQTILAAGTDTDLQTHGTHVAGIAAGSGAGTQYYGLAPAAELVLVSTTRTDTGIADGLKYIADYATEQNKPCVINLSLGSSIGPHDGTSAFDRLCDRTTKPGLLFTGSAGNNGNQQIYLEQEFTTGSNDSVIYSGMIPQTGAEQMIADIWGTPASEFSARIALLDTTTGQWIDSTVYISSGQHGVRTFNVEEDSIIMIIQIASELSIYNKKPNILIQVNFVVPSSSLIPILGIKNKANGKIQSWLTRGIFSNLGYDIPYLSGNNSHTIGEIGGTGKSILSAGAFCTKPEWEAYDGMSYHYGPEAIPGTIANFSSRGPTADGRIKPDISCPGFGVVSSYSHFFSGAYPPGYYRTNSIQFNNIPYFFGILQGTSEAAPIVAGTLALWLQQNPTITLPQARQIIRETAIPIPGQSLPNNSWGWGILNAGGGMQQIK